MLGQQTFLASILTLAIFIPAAVAEPPEGKGKKDGVANFQVFDADDKQVGYLIQLVETSNPGAQIILEFSEHTFMVNLIGIGFGNTGNRIHYDLINCMGQAYAETVDLDTTRFTRNYFGLLDKTIIDADGTVFVPDGVSVFAEIKSRFLGTGSCPNESIMLDVTPVVDIINLFDEFTPPFKVRQVQ